MMIAFFYSMAAELVGLSAIVGSFLAGVALEGVVIRHGKDYREGAEYLHIIFASIFFVSLGILVDFHAMTPDVIWFLIALTLVAVVTKVAGCYIPCRLQGIGHRDSMIIGWGMSPRGEVAMIVALIGLNAGLIGQGIYVSLVLMSLITTIITPVVLRTGYRMLLSTKPNLFSQVENCQFRLIQQMLNRRFWQLWVSHKAGKET